LTFGITLYRIYYPQSNCTKQQMVQWLKAMLEVLF